MAIGKFLKSIIFPDSDPEYDPTYDDQDSFEALDAPETETVTRQPRTPERQDAPTYTAPAPVSAVNMTSGSAIEMKVVKPSTLDAVTEIADYLLDRKTVLLNLEDSSKETSRRLLDFLNGVCYAINGVLKKVASSTYVVTPNNVSVSGENIKDAGDSSENI